LAGDGMDATLVFYYLKRCSRRKEFAEGGRGCSKHPNKFGQHQTARTAKDARKPSEIAGAKSLS
jgi:hypothetical protein